ncbi:MAG: CotH kinase family protein [Clostridia bacterium]|nr:CotH kinase family protein [Clostridia bacterium]
MKRFFCFAAAAALFALLLCLCACGGAREGCFGVLAVPGRADTRIDAWKSGDGAYYLFLPADADRGALTAVCGETAVTVDGVPLTDGEPTDAFAKDTLTVTVGRQSATLHVLQSDGLPAVYIQTETGSLEAVHADKEHKEPAAMTVVEHGAVALDEAPLAHIKGRGRSTWKDAEKKPYNIKLEEKTDLLGMGKAKKWALMADASENAFLKESLAFDLARQTGLVYTPESRPVDLYINGEYRGLYRVCEKAEVGPERLDIFDADKANERANPGTALSSFPREKSGAGLPDRLNPGELRWYALENEPENVPDACLLELTDEPDAESAFCTARGQLVSLASPKYASRRQVEAAARRYAAAEDALYGGGDIGAYFDLAGFSDMYLLREFLMDYDAGVSSTFFYLNGDDGKFRAGPVWDFEGSMPFGLRCFGVDFSDPAQWWANACPHLSVRYTERDGGGTPETIRSDCSFFAAMYRHDAFRAVVRDRWRALSPVFAGAGDRIAELQRRTEDARTMDLLRWPPQEDFTPEQARLRQAEAAGTIAAFLADRLRALGKGFAENAALLYYDANGGEGVMFHNEILSVGETATLKAPNAETQNALLFSILLDGKKTYADVDGLLSPPSEEYQFTGWNTAPDGSGETYRPGDGIVLQETTTVLYAQWAEKN